MNNKTIYIAIILLLVISSSCEKYDNLIPSEYDKILALKEVGEQKLILYKTGEDGSYTFTILKGGNKPSLTSSANITAMDEVELAAYSESVNRNYTLLPSSTYNIVTPEFDFEASEVYKTGEVVFKTSSIDKLLTESTNNGKYVLPLELTSINDSVNIKKNLVILQPEVIIPKVSFSKDEEKLVIAGKEATYDLTLSLPFESIWNFDCEIAVDEKALPEGFELIKKEDYTIENEGKIRFVEGSRTSEPIKITIKNSDMFGSTYVIPFKIVKVSMQGFDISESCFFLYGAYNKILLAPGMLSTNAQEATEGPIANLVDNNPATYFHSSWSVAIDEAHYFQVKLEHEITMCRFDYQNRNNTNGKPQSIQIQISSDGNNWEELVAIPSGLPDGPGSTYSSDEYTANKTFKYLRFIVLKTNGGVAPTFFNMAEFSLFGK